MSKIVSLLESTDIACGCVNASAFVEEDAMSGSALTISCNNDMSSGAGKSSVSRASISLDAKDPMDMREICLSGGSSGKGRLGMAKSIAGRATDAGVLGGGVI